MKYLPLIFAGIARHRVRTALIAAQIVFVFMLFGVLQGLDASLAQAVRRTHAERMFVGSRLGASDVLPVSLWPQLQKVPGVARVTFESQLPCTYRGPRQYAWALGIDPASYFAVYYENRTTPAQLHALQSLRTGALVGAVMAQRFGWQAGQHVTLQCFVPQTSGSSDWQFDIVGQFQETERPELSDILLINYSYLNEARAVNRDGVNNFGLVVRDPAEVADIGRTIDSLFANSANPTETRSESESAQQNLNWIGDVGFLARWISIAAFAALVVAAATLAMQSIRERRRDIAVLKVTGFSDLRVHLLVLTESVVVWVSSAAVGLCIAAVALPRAQYLIWRGGALPVTVAVAGLLCALVFGAISALVPAWHASRTTLVEALSDQ